MYRARCEWPHELEGARTVADEAFHIISDEFLDSPWPEAPLHFRVDHGVAGIGCNWH